MSQDPILQFRRRIVELGLLQEPGHLVLGPKTSRTIGAGMQMPLHGGLGIGVKTPIEIVDCDLAPFVYMCVAPEHHTSSPIVPGGVTSSCDAGFLAPGRSYPASTRAAANASLARKMRDLMVPSWTPRISAASL